MKGKTKRWNLFTPLFVLALLAFFCYHTANYSVIVRVPGEVLLDEVVFNDEHFSLLSPAPYPPPGLAGGVTVQEKGTIRSYAYPRADDSLRGYTLKFDSQFNSKTIDVYLWKKAGPALAREVWETLFALEGSVLAKDRGRIKKRGYAYAKITSFYGGETLLWQRGEWVVLVKSTQVIEPEGEKLLLRELFAAEITAKN